MKLDLILRRTHLYLGLLLLPVFLMYGVSSFAFSHPSWFQPPPGTPRNDWTLRSERPYQLDGPPSMDNQALGARIMKDTGMNGAFGVWRPPGQNRIEVIRMGFVSASRAVYLPDLQRLRIEDRQFRWGNFLTGMHARGGFQYEPLLNDLWAVLVDIVSLAMLGWVGTGLYLWWKRRPTRNWGWLAIVSGWAVFGLFLWLL